MAKLTLNQDSGKQEEPPSPTDSDTTVDNPFQTRRTRFTETLHHDRAGTSHQRFSHRSQGGGSSREAGHTHWPKLAFPHFDGTNPSI